jgi:methionyl-tRNA formyltransferase
MKKLTVFAMTEKGYAVVKFLLSAYPGLVAAVVASRDKRLVKDYFDEIAQLCRASHVSFRDRTDGISIQTDYALAVAWRWLIDAGAVRLIVLHDSLLPRYRGFNPLVTALINGDKEIGVTALYATAEYDRGDIIAQSSSAISYPIRIRDAIKILAGNYEALAASIAASLTRGDEPPSKPQDEAAASYSLWRDEEDYFVDWSHSAGDIKRFIDAVGYPYKGAAATLEGRVVRIRDAEALDDLRIANRTAGKVIFLKDAKPVVVCGRGLLRATELFDDQTGASLLPLPRFRVRFTGKAQQVAPARVAQPGSEMLAP